MHIEICECCRPENMENWDRGGLWDYATETTAEFDYCGVCCRFTSTVEVWEVDGNIVIDEPGTDGLDRNGGEYGFFTIQVETRKFITKK